jgi:hypothetical protein
MIPAHVYISNLDITRRASDIEGCVVECGVWRGGMIAGMADLLGPGRRYFLFDSFEGLPPAREIDGQRAIAWQANKHGPSYHDNCSARVELAREAMEMSRASSYHIVKGWFQETLPNFEPEVPIAVLRLDGDWFDSTLVCLDNLFPRLARGGLVIIDDYYTWDGCSRAVHHFLATTQSTGRISSPFGVCLLTASQEERATPPCDPAQE